MIRITRSLLLGGPAARTELQKTRHDVPTNVDRLSLYVGEQSKKSETATPPPAPTQAGNSPARYQHGWSFPQGRVADAELLIGPRSGVRGLGLTQHELKSNVTSILDAKYLYVRREPIDGPLNVA